MINRAFESEWLNRVVNHPDVLPHVSENGKELDLTEIVLNQDNVVLEGEFGAIIFIKHLPGLYEAHTQVLPEGRGRWALKFAHKCLEYMFCATDAVEIVTKVPEGNKGALGLARLLKFDFDFTNPVGWRTNGNPVSTDIYSLTISRWAGFAPEISKLGKWFHSELENQYKELNKIEPLHPESDTHDKYVGICVKMIEQGQIFKAINFYNRWAIMSSYIPMILKSINPIIIDMTESVLHVVVSDERVSFKVIEVR